MVKTGGYYGENNGENNGLPEGITLGWWFQPTLYTVSMV